MDKRVSKQSGIKTLVDLATDGILVLDGAGVVVECNSFAEQITEYPRELLLGLKVEELVPKNIRDHHPSLRANFNDSSTWRRMLADRRDVNLVNYAGKEVAVDIALAPLDLGSGLGVIVIISDQRQSRLAEVRLQLQSLIVEVTDNMVVVFDENRNVVWVNPAWEKQTGYKLDEVIGQRLVSFTTGPDSDPEIARNLFSQAQDQGFAHGELLLYTRAGQPLWLELDIHVLPGYGQENEAIAIGRNITKLKEAEEQRLLHKKQIEKAYQLAGIGTWELELETNQLHWSEITFRIFGIDPQSVSWGYEAFESMVHPEDRERITEIYWESVTNHTEYSATHRLILPDGQIRHVHERCQTSYAEDGTPLRSIGTVQDITDRVEAQELLAAKHVAEAANEAKSGFLATMSHEIRTPLHGIIGNLDLLQNSKLESAQTRMLSRAMFSADSLLGLLSDILDFSKIEAGHVEIVREPLKLRNLIEDVALSLYELARDKSVRLLLEMSSDVDLFVLGDEQRIRQIVTNLLSNAIKFSAGRNNACCRVRLETRVNKNVSLAVRLEVIDNGIGMTKSEQAQVFNLFSQADASTTKNFGGTGLGLSIVRNLCEMMDGEVSVESQPDIGSTFTVTLSLALADQAEPPVQTLAGRRLLLVMMDPDLLKIIQNQLRFAGAQTSHIQTLEQLGSSAPPHNLAKDQYDLIIACPGLLRGDPTEFLRTVVTQGIPTLLLSDNPTLVDEELSAQARVLRYPYKVDALLVGVAAVGKTLTNPGLARVEPAAHSVTGGEKQPILVAEDNEIIQEVIAAQLNHLGYEVVIANDGYEALGRFHEQPYAAVITDAHMPRLSGNELVAAIREREADAGQHTPVLVLTADVTQQTAERCVDSGADVILGKPLTMVALSEALEQWVKS